MYIGRGRLGGSPTGPRTSLGPCQAAGGQIGGEGGWEGGWGGGPGGGGRGGGGAGGGRGPGVFKRCIIWCKIAKVQKMSTPRRPDFSPPRPPAGTPPRAPLTPLQNDAFLEKACKSYFDAGGGETEFETDRMMLKKGN